MHLVRRSCIAITTSPIRITPPSHSRSSMPETPQSRYWDATGDRRDRTPQWRRRSQREAGAHRIDARSHPVPGVIRTPRVSGPLRESPDRPMECRPPEGWRQLVIPLERHDETRQVVTGNRVDRCTITEELTEAVEHGFIFAVSVGLFQRCDLLQVFRDGDVQCRLSSTVSPAVSNPGTPSLRPSSSWCLRRCASSA